MEVKIRPPAELEIVLSLARDEVDDLVEATRPGRRTKAHQRILERFGDCLRSAVTGSAGDVGDYLHRPVIGGPGQRDDEEGDK